MFNDSKLPGGDLVADPRLEWAERYISWGWHIFVLGESKVPLANCPECANAGPEHDKEACDHLTCHAFYAATKDILRVTEMLRRVPNGQLAVRTGAASGVDVIDAEGPEKERPEGEQPGTATLDEWESWTGWSLPPTLTATTPSAGLHLFYGHVPGTRSRNRALPGLDVKADGGYVALPSGLPGRGWVPGPETPTVASPELALWFANGGGGGGANGSSSGQRFDVPGFLAGSEWGRQEEDLFGYGRSCRARNMRWDEVEAATRVAFDHHADRPGDKKGNWTWEQWRDKVHRGWSSVEPGWSSREPTEGDLAWVRFITGETTEAVPDDARPKVDTKEIVDAYRRQKAQDIVRRLLREEEIAAARGPRLKRTAAEYADTPPPEVVVTSVLAAEVNLLGGPSEAGKSLLARDWALHVAAGVPWRGFPVLRPRRVLFIASEGTHDFRERWASQPLWSVASGGIFVLDEPVNLTSREDVGWLLDRYEDERPGLVIFDVIYGMGLPDDNGTKDVLPVIAAMKRISAQWHAATLALGHPGHGGDRRFRGSSMWRQLAAVEWHMADGRLSCEKSKLADGRQLGAVYRVEYPAIRWPEVGEVVADEATRLVIIRRDLADVPNESDTARARRLGPVLGLQERRMRQLIKLVREEPV